MAGGSIWALQIKVEGRKSTLPMPGDESSLCFSVLRGSGYLIIVDSGPKIHSRYGF